MKIKVKFLNCWQENYPEEGPEVVCVFLDEVKRIKKTTPSHLLNDALLDCYVHDGQFVTTSYGYLKAGKLASKEEYLPLLTELYYVGYKKMSWKSANLQGFDFQILKLSQQGEKIMSTTNNMNTRLFIDMDGTLAVWKQATCFEDLLQPGYFRDLPPYQTVLDAVKILCNTKPELDVYALSAYMPENPYAVHEKNAWLDAYLPEIDSEHRIFVACGSSKARAAANRLKTPCIDNSFVLLDDYSVNLHEWKANRGSCIKLRNGINGNGGTWKGESVTRFDTAENIADRIWSTIQKLTNTKEN